MKIAIIGGGYTGLAASYYLSKKGIKTTIFEKDKSLGGLASGFKDKKLKWSLDKYYHHIFVSDTDIIKLAKEVGCSLISLKPKTSIFYDGNIYCFDSPFDLITFPHIPFLSRFRTGMVILYLKVITNWKPLERITASKFIRKTSGYPSWKIIWQPLFKAKFDKAAEKIPASWFWSRIKKRGSVFMYPKGGFDALTNSIVRKINKRRVNFLLNTEVKSIIINKDKIEIKTSKKIYSDFDKVICTLSTDLFLKISPKLPKDYLYKLRKLEGKGTVNLILSLKHKFLIDGTYWLNINDRLFPFIGIVEHTNFISKAKYNNNNIIHIVNYLPSHHRYFKTDKKTLTKIFIPFLKKINPEFERNWINKAWLFKSPFAQPVITLNYSKKIPSLETPIKNVYLANLQQVYPWDRQTNYAIALGKEVSKRILKVS